jgi:DNA adenine methylase
MQYVGSKRRIAKKILEHIEAVRKPNQLYVEPFMGGCNMLDKVSGRRWGNDSHFHLVSLFEAIRDGWHPPHEVTKEDYYYCKSHSHELMPAAVGFVGFSCSFGVKWWGGFASNKEGRNYARTGRNSLLKQAPLLEGVRFTNNKYHELNLTESCLIYCDPPYAGVTQYADKFDSDAFWIWAKQKASEGHTVFVSEYNAPDGVECIDEFPLTSTLNKNAKDKKIEKLFRL